MKKIALITGASSGIGMASAKVLAEMEYNLILCGRNQTAINELQEQIKTETYALFFDIRYQHEVYNAIHGLPEHWQSVDLLINNAGNAHGLDTIDTSLLEDDMAMIDGNVKGLIYVSKAIIPWMVARNKGHIINISSIAGKQTYRNGTVYCASKAAVEALSQGMRLDLVEHGIKVSNLAPGAVETEFSNIRFKGDTHRASQVYDGFEPLIAEDIADIVGYIASRPDRVQIADVLVLPKAQANVNTFYKQ